MKIVIIGAGIMGLAAAHRALAAGHEVDVVEAAPIPGGMAAHFDFGGLSIERFYHFVCMNDRSTFELMDELGIGDRMVWSRTTMGWFMKGRVHRWGDPFALLTFPHLSFIAKLRTGLHMFLTTRARDFTKIEHLTARDWLIRGSGREVYEKLWHDLLRLKFFELADGISASWIATRVKRIGRSRTSLFNERLGYVAGGSQTLVDALVGSIEGAGGKIHLSLAAEKVRTARSADGTLRVTGVSAGKRLFTADAVISTVPTPLVPGLVPDLPDDARKAYAGIKNIGVVCVALKLKRSVSPHFWVNVSDPELPIPGFIEFSNLRPMEGTVVYVPFYMPDTHPRWTAGDEELIAEAFSCLKKVNPALTDDDLIDARAGRLKHAQPVCGPNFLDGLPPVLTPIKGLAIADTCFYYPEDRGFSESIRLGRQLASDLMAAEEATMPAAASASVRAA